jgi:hypothetical protein
LQSQPDCANKAFSTAREQTGPQDVALYQGPTSELAEKRLFVFDLSSVWFVFIIVEDICAVFIGF